VLYQYKGFDTSIKEFIPVSSLFYRYNPLSTGRKGVWREKPIMTGDEDLNGRIDNRVFGVKRSKPVGISDQNNLKTQTFLPFILSNFFIPSLLSLLTFSKLSSAGASSTPRLKTTPTFPAAYRRTPGDSTTGREEREEQSRHAPPGIPVPKSAPALEAGVEKAPHRRGASGSFFSEKTGLLYGRRYEKVILRG
jgi:hypothetical protein